jgi:hypothetical protein
MDINEARMVTPKQLPELLVDIIKAKLVPNIISSPGLGKSDIVRQVANEHNLQLIDMRLSQMDVTDILGFPNIVNGRSAYLPPEMFPIEEDLIPTDKNGWILFLDELSSASPAVQAASYQLILDRMTGKHNLHKNVALIAAGNKMSDKAVVSRTSTALQSRMVHLELKVNKNDWIEWADTHGVDYRVKGFIEFKPDLLHKFDPNHSDVTFPAPRTWDFISRIIKDWKNIPDSKLPILAGTVGTGAAFEFKHYCKEYDNLPTINQILNNPESITVPQEPSTLFAITSLISHNLTPQTVSKIIKFINRLPKEFQIITLQGAIRMDKLLLKEEVIKGWISNNSRELF